MNTIPLFDFDSEADSARTLKRISQLMQRAGQPVVSFDFDKRVRRIQGIASGYREANLTLASGQIVTLRVKESGDVYQVLLNSQLKALKNQDDMGKAIGEIAGMADANQGKFQAALARKKVDMPKGIKTAAPKLEQVLTERNAELNAQIAERQQQVEAIKAELGDAGEILDSAELLDDAKRPAFDPKTDRWVTTRSGSHLMIRGGSVVGGAGGKLNGWRQGESAPSVDSGKPAEKRYERSPARYSKGNFAIRPRKDGSGFKTDEASLADAVANGRYSGREKAYIMSKSQADLFEALVNAGASSVSFLSRDVKLDGKTMTLPEARKHLKKSGVTFDSTDDDGDLDEPRELTIDDVLGFAQGLSAGAVLDGVDASHAVATLQAALDMVETNRPINLAAGNIEQAELEARCAESYRQALAILDSAEEDDDQSALFDGSDEGDEKDAEPNPDQQSLI